MAHRIGDRTPLPKNGRITNKGDLADLYIAPPRDQCHREIMPVDLAFNVRLTQSLWYSEQRMVYFSITLSEIDSKGRGNEFYSVDTGHGYYHEHTTGHQKAGDRQDLKALFWQVEVAESYDRAYSRVMERYSMWKAENGVNDD